MGRSSGRKRAAVLGFLGLTTAAADEPEAEYYQQAAGWQQQYPQCQEHHYASKVRASDEDGYADGRPWWYAERDIDRRASEFIDRVHRGMLAAGDGPAPAQRY